MSSRMALTHAVFSIDHDVWLRFCHYHTRARPQHGWHSHHPFLLGCLRGYHVSGVLLPHRHVSVFELFVSFRISDGPIPTGGTSVKKSRSVIVSSLPPLRWPVPSVVCLPPALERWTVSPITPPGGGFSSSVPKPSPKFVRC